MLQPGICQIKSQYILEEKPRVLAVECVSHTDLVKLDIEETNEKKNNKRNPNHYKSEEGPSKKKQKLSKKLQGQNKARGPTYKLVQEKELCNSLINYSGVKDSCDREQCKFYMI
ncbi:hypothetical protein HHI36_005666 [Cryptolaemus montrouzieri]|uniref:Uncharacterized protein n=1 Tax=Cryptolaemus montrouzieri TaxID=559131 RepID=A0ABD2NUV6_9CUCU